VWGAPEYFRLIGNGGEDAQVRQAVDGAFTVVTDQLALVELIPEGACRGGLRMRAEVRHNAGGQARGDGPARGGLYVGHSDRSRGGADKHLFADLTFSEGIESPKKGESLGAYFFALRRIAAGAEEQRLELAHEVFRLPDVERGAWRSLEVQIRPDGILTFREGKQSGMYARRQLHEAAALGFPDVGLPLFPPDGGVGLYVYQASMSFRNVEVTPLE
jgi:hypothetical protein